MKKSGSILALMIVAFLCNSYAEISLTAFSKEEALHEKNISKPRIFIKNTGTEPVSDFYCLYFFTAENGRMPVIENYYTPNESVSLEYLGNNRYAVRYDFNGITLQPGEIFPDQSGNVIGIHYQGWESLCKQNDGSQNFSADFIPNRNIAIFSSSGFPVDQHPYRNHRNTQVVNTYTMMPDNSLDINIHIHR